MQKIVLLFSLCFIISLTVQAQNDINASLNAATRNYLDAYIQKDVNALLGYTHPNILEMGGGEQYLVEDIAGELEMITAQGLEYFGAEILEVGNNWELNGEKFFLVPHSWLVELGGNKFRSVTYLLATTKDEGENWSFINTNKYNAKNLAVYIPEFDDTIEFPMASPFEQIFDE